MLKKEEVVGYFIDIFGDGIKNIFLVDLAEITNMAPEYGIKYIYKYL